MSVFKLNDICSFSPPPQYRQQPNAERVMEVDLFTVYLRVLDDEQQYENGFVQHAEHTQKQATKELLEKYSITGLKVANSLNFDRLELRLAYLFLYSTCHSHMVLFALSRYRQMTRCVELIKLMATAATERGTFNLLSLGGGPGSDPVGFLAFLNRSGLLRLCPPLQVTVVDAYFQWMGPFKNLMSRFFSTKLQKSDFLVQNLLMPLRPEVAWSLRDTHFLSMLKFLSAIAGNEEGTKQILSTIFELLPLGALVLVIDNSGGKAFKQALGSAALHGLRPVYGPACHIKFQVDKTLEPRLDQPRFGFRAQTNCTISIMILQKQANLVQLQVVNGGPPNHWNNGYIHRTCPRRALQARGSQHPYGRAPVPAHERPVWTTPVWTTRPPPYSANREITHPGLLPSSYALAQNVSQTFGAVQNIAQQVPWF